MPEPVSASGRPPARTLPEALVRALRHEVGDFLQKVYATVAILQNRLPAELEVEQGLIRRLRSRAADCTKVLDNAHDFICPLALDCEEVDLTQVAESLAAEARQHHPDVTIHTEATGPVVVLADARRVAQLGDALLANACAAAKTVWFRTAARPETAEAEWEVTDDGPGVPPEQAGRLFTPFFTIHAGHAGLGLALAQKIVQLHGGRISADNRPGGGFRVSIVFPADGPPENGQPRTA